MERAVAKSLVFRCQMVCAVGTSRREREREDMHRELGESFWKLLPSLREGLYLLHLPVPYRHPHMVGFE